MYDKLIFGMSSPGRQGVSLPKIDVEDLPLEEMLGPGLLREGPIGLPEVSERDIARHYTHLSSLNYGVDTGIYPLGSCTMKYNPKINEDIASLEGFWALHPLQPIETAQGTLEMLYDLSSALSSITGMEAFSLTPAAGAQGELAGLMVIKAYLKSIGQGHRDKILIPDSAHGTNPASASQAGFKAVNIPSGSDKLCDIEALREAAGPDTAAIMLTNPNTLGMFEKRILEITSIVHEAGGLCYYDGANLNAIMGAAKPSAMGFDVMHANVHKTFSTPHGGGGPGAGPLGVRSFLKDFMPGPIPVKTGEAYALEYPKASIGSLRGFYGSVGVLLRAYSYILVLGGEGLKEASEMACLNANYLKKKLSISYKEAFEGPCMHEFTLSGLKEPVKGIKTEDIAKRLIDYGFHPPTVYFPLIVEEALMIEPTETESIESLDSFANAMLKIADETREDPTALKCAPVNAPVGRVDSLKAAKEPKLTALKR